MKIRTMAIASIGLSTVIILIAVGLIFYFNNDNKATEVDYYPTFLNLIKESQIESVCLDGNIIYANLINEKRIVAYRPVDENITQLLIKNKIPVTAKKDSLASYVKMFYIFFMTFFIPMFVFFSQMQILKRQQY